MPDPGQVIRPPERAGIMRRWVVTGPTGAGKSLLTRLLARQGAAIIDADAVGHEVLRQPEVRQAVATAFGQQFLTGGEVDRPAMGELVFAEPEALARLSAITHPPLAAALVERLGRLADAGQTALAVVEAAVYFLLPSLGPMDLTIAVVAPEAVRHRRLVSAGLSEQQAQRRIAAQVPMNRLWSQADLVIENIGTEKDLARVAEELISTRR